MTLYYTTYRDPNGGVFGTTVKAKNKAHLRKLIKKRKLREKFNGASWHSDYRYKKALVRGYRPSLIFKDLMSARSLKVQGRLCSQLIHSVTFLFMLAMKAGTLKKSTKLLADTSLIHQTVHIIEIFLDYKVSYGKRIPKWEREMIQEYKKLESLVPGLP